MPNSAQIANNFGVARNLEAFPLTRSWSPGSNTTDSLKPATRFRRLPATHALTTASKYRNETACPVKPLLRSERHVQPLPSGLLQAVRRSATKAPIAACSFSSRPLRSFFRREAAASLRHRRRDRPAGLDLCERCYCKI